MSFLAVNLLGKPTGEFIRFIFALTRRSPIVLMGNDLERQPAAAIELYGLRVRVETMFAMLKHLLGAFHYHFWSKRLPRHSRKPKKNQSLKPPTQDDLPPVQRCWEGYERFAMLAAIALGLLQLIALKFAPEVWGRFNTFLRTRSRQIPSERTVKDVVGQLVLEDFLNVVPSAIMQEIRDHFLVNQKAPQESQSDMKQKVA